MEALAKQEVPSDVAAVRLNVRALLLSDRLSVDRTGYKDVLSTAPFCFRQSGGYVVIFRYGVIVLVGLDAANERAVLAQYSQSAHTVPIEEERLELVLKPDQDEGATTSGTLQVRD